jgi:hypothetical protein
VPVPVVFVPAPVPAPVAQRAPAVVRCVFVWFLGVDLID